MHAFSFSHHQRHSHTTQTPKENVCVCVCVCVFVCVIAEKRRAVAERVSLWAGFLDQTATCRLGKHQSKCLCRTADSPATARTLQDHLHQPTDKVSTCGLEKYMQPECACKSTAENVTQRTTKVLRYRAHFSRLCRDEQPRKPSFEAIKHEKPLTVPEVLFRRESVSL